jgi:hypothetical protein
LSLEDLCEEVFPDFDLSDGLISASSHAIIDRQDAMISRAIAVLVFIISNDCTVNLE